MSASPWDNMRGFTCKPSFSHEAKTLKQCAHCCTKRCLLFIKKNTEHLGCLGWKLHFLESFATNPPSVMLKQRRCTWMCEMAGRECNGCLEVSFSVTAQGTGKNRQTDILSRIQQDHGNSADVWKMIERLLDLNTNLIEEGTRCRWGWW